jgi:hypothetical protein
MENIEKELQTAIEMFGQPHKVIAGNEAFGELCKKHCTAEVKVNGVKLRNDKILFIYPDKNISLPVPQKPIAYMINVGEVEPPTVEAIVKPKQKRRN